MRSTGEVMGIDRSFARAFLKSQLGAGTPLPETGTAFVSVRDADKEAIVEAARILERLGLTVVATSGTCDYLNARGVAAERVNKVHEGRPHIVDRMKDGHIAIVFNTTEGAQAVRDSYDIRATALGMRIPYYTTAAGAVAAAKAIANLKEGALEVAPLQDYARRLKGAEPVAAGG
jgi:carbamoyl-phosphate synthase large subunit